MMWLSEVGRTVWLLAMNLEVLEVWPAAGFGVVTGSGDGESC